MVGLRPVSHTRIMAVLSSYTSNCAGRAQMFSHRAIAGIPYVRSPWAAATISASGVLCDVAFCRFACASKGKREDGPYSPRCTPDVDLNVSLQPTKSASENSASARSLALSPIHPYNLKCLVVLM